MGDTWTKEQVVNAFKNLLIDSELFSHREREDIIRLKFSLQDLANMLGGRIEALKRDNANLRALIGSKTDAQGSLFARNRFVQAPPDFVSQYRREILNRETVRQQLE